MSYAQSASHHSRALCVAPACPARLPAAMRQHSLQLWKRRLAMDSDRERARAEARDRDLELAAVEMGRVLASNAANAERDAMSAASGGAGGGGLGSQATGRSGDARPAQPAIKHFGVTASHETAAYLERLMQAQVRKMRMQMMLHCTHS